MIISNTSGHCHARCRLVHRLDMAATGALAVARTPDAATWLAAAFARPAIGLATDATGSLPFRAHACLPAT